MARVTIADCAKRIPNQFTLIEAAAKRARQLTAGQEALVDWEGDKAIVVALREIAEGFIDESILVEKKEDPAEELFETATENTSETVDQALQAAIEATLSAEGTSEKNDSHNSQDEEPPAA